jgi:two-component system, NarL family, sensor kinase
MATLPSNGATLELENTLALLISENEAEIERLGRTLHDDIGQMLSAAGLQVAALRLEYADAAGLAERAAELQTTLERAMAQVRQLSAELNPSVVERCGLRFALDRLVERYQPVFSGPVQILFPPDAYVPREISGMFYRVAEYAIEHALRRSDASNVDIEITATGRQMSMEIRHNGVMLPPNSEGNAAERVELLVLHYHAKRAGVPVSIESVPGKGTVVRTSYSGQPKA